MDFKLTELKDVLIEKKGLVPVAIALVLNFILFFLFFLPLIPLFFLLGFGDESAFGFGLVITLLAFGFIALISIPLSSFIQAGQYGSIKQIITEDEFKPKDYWKHMKKYFLPVLGYSLLYGIAIVFVTFPISFIGGMVSAFIPVIGFMLELLLLLLVMAFTLFTSPIVYLSVVEGNKFDHMKKFYKEKGKEFAIICLGFSFLMIIPFISFIVSFLAFVLPVYILVLFYGNTDSKNVVVENED